MVKAAIHPYHLHNHANQMTKVNRERGGGERGERKREGCSDI